MNLWSKHNEGLETSLLKFDYLYSGDVINSIDSKISLKTSKVNKLIESIYDYSIISMIEKSVDKEVFDLTSLKDAISLASKYKYAFVNNTFINYLKHGSAFTSSIKLESKNHQYFMIPYKKDMYRELSLGLLDIYSIDNILNKKKLNNENEMIMYVTDKPIQSLIYTMNTSNYYMENNNHIIEYKLFNCDYNCKKIIIRDKEVDRNNKLNKLIGDN